MNSKPDFRLMILRGSSYPITTVTHPLLQRLNNMLWIVLEINSGAGYRCLMPRWAWQTWCLLTTLTLVFRMRMAVHRWPRKGLIPSWISCFLVGIRIFRTPLFSITCWSLFLTQPTSIFLICAYSIDVFFRCDPCGSRVLHRPSFLASMLLSPRDPGFPHSAILHAIVEPVFSLVYPIAQLFRPLVCFGFSMVSTKCGNSTRWHASRPVCRISCW